MRCLSACASATWRACSLPLRTAGSSASSDATISNKHDSHRALVGPGVHEGPTASEPRSANPLAPRVNLEEPWPAGWPGVAECGNRDVRALPASSSFRSNGLPNGLLEIHSTRTHTGLELRSQPDRPNSGGLLAASTLLAPGPAAAAPTG